MKTKILVVNNGGSNAKLTPLLIVMLKRLNAQVIVSEDTKDILSWLPKVDGVILSGGPLLLSDRTRVCAWSRNAAVLFHSRVPVLCICFGFQVLAAISGGQVKKRLKFRQGLYQCVRQGSSKLFAGLPHQFPCYVKHRDHVTSVPPDFTVTLKECEIIQAIERRKKPYIAAVQFHPENTPEWGIRIIQNFLLACR